MIRMEDTTRRPKPFLDPKTLAGTVAVAMLMYVLWQPAVQLLLHAVWGDPLPFATRAEWARFVAVCATLGAAAGLILWHSARLRRRGLVYARVRSSVTMLAVGVVISAGQFSRDSLGVWLLTLMVIALATGAMFIPLFRWADRDEAPPPQPRSGAA
jgi:hypothetical protein